MAAGVRRNRRRECIEHDHVETLTTRRQRGGPDADVHGQPADCDAYDAALAQVVGQAGALEGGVSVGVEGSGLAQTYDVVGQGQLGVETCPRGVLHAVHRPVAAAMYEAHVVDGMPVPRGHHQRTGAPGGIDFGIDAWHQRAPPFNGQGPALAEVVLHVDDQQCGIGSVLHLGHDVPPADHEW